MSLQIQIGGHIRTPPPLRTSIGSTGSNSSGHSSISHFSISPQEYLANPMFDSLNDNRRSGFNRYWPTGVHVGDKTISLKPLVVKRTRNLQRKLPLNRNGCRVIWKSYPQDLILKLYLWSSLFICYFDTFFLYTQSFFLYLCNNNSVLYIRSKTYEINNRFEKINF